jgi:cobalt/nickel transport system permease protein
MFEDLLEDIAQKNAIRDINPWCKLLAGVGAIVLCLVSTGYIAPLFIAFVLTGSIFLIARIDTKTYAGLFVVPFGFALTGIAGIILISGGSTVFWSWDLLPWLSLSITKESLNYGFFIFSRMIGGMSALCFIALTTPMTDIFSVMRQCRIPHEIIDLSMIIYRTIFIIMDQVLQIYQAQVMRLGYATIRESVQSFAAMCGAAFIASWNSGEDLIRAMDARCYDGKFAVLGKNSPLEPLPLAAVCAFLLAASGAVIASQGMTLL